MIYFLFNFFDICWFIYVRGVFFGFKIMRENIGRVELIFVIIRIYLILKDRLGNIVIREVKRRILKEVMKDIILWFFFVIVELSFFYLDL